MDGYEFLRELRQRPVHPPVVAISGLASEDDLGRMREAGFHAHIKKPFDAAAVIAAVEAAVRYRKEQPPAALAPAAPQTPQPAGIAERKATRAERRSIARDAGDRSGGSAHGKTFSADRDDARQRASGSPKRHP
jgi:DNA-binding response OmpR family regulator